MYLIDNAYSTIFIILPFPLFFLYAFSQDSPVLWIRVDPDMKTLRHVKLEQPDYMWQYMLRYERDVVAQSEVG